MKTFLTFLLVLAVASSAAAFPSVKTLKRKTLKTAFLTTVVATSSLRMLKEADEFDQRELLGKNTYHAVEFGIVCGLVATGFLTYAVVKQPEWTVREKTALLGSGLLAAWEVGEGTYKLKRWENWFDNDPAHNRNAIPWYQVHTKPFSFSDNFIGTGRTTTTLLHLGRISASAYLAAKAE